MRNPIQESSIFVHGVHIFRSEFQKLSPEKLMKIWRILPRNDLMTPTVKVSSFDSPRFHVMLIDSGSLHVANGFSGVGQKMFHISVPFHMLL